MAYQVYTTPALVCGSFDRNTSDRFYYLFTRDAGMVLAHAKSVREEKSKHRFALQEFSLVDVSLVRGRTGWKITGSVSTENYYFVIQDRAKRATLLRIVTLLRRLVQGEENHRGLFAEVCNGFHVLGRCSHERVAILEVLLTLKIVSALGYVAPTEVLQQFLNSEYDAAFEAAAASPQPLIDAKKAIDEALMVAQL